MINTRTLDAITILDLHGPLAAGQDDALLRNKIRAAFESGAKTVINRSNVYNPNARDGNAVVSPEASMEIVDSTVENEDYRIAESTQRTIESGLIENFLFGRNEVPLHHFHNHFRAALNMPPLQPPPTVTP